MAVQSVDLGSCPHKGFAKKVPCAAIIAGIAVYFIYGSHEDRGGGLFASLVRADETFIGGLEKNKHEHNKLWAVRGSSREAAGMDDPVESRFPAA